jgi:DNA-binding MarR family transcriptional regulator
VTAEPGMSEAAKRKYTPLDVARAGRRLDMALAEMHLDVSGSMGMTAAELLAIAHLGMEGDLGPTELAQRLHLHTGAITALLDRLSERGYAVREPHPSDRRKVVVSLTKKGRDDVMVHLGPMVDEVIELVRRLPEADRRTIGRFLDEFAALVNRRTAATPPR